MGVVFAVDAYGNGERCFLGLFGWTYAGYDVPAVWREPHADGLPVGRSLEWNLSYLVLALLLVNGKYFEMAAAVVGRTPVSNHDLVVVGGNVRLVAVRCRHRMLGFDPARFSVCNQEPSLALSMNCDDEYAPVRGGPEPVAEIKGRLVALDELRRVAVQLP